MSTDPMAAMSVPPLDEDTEAGRGRTLGLVALAAILAVLATFFIGRLSGGSEKTVHVKHGSKSHSVVVVAKTSPSVKSLASASIAPLVTPPAPVSSGGSTSSTGGTSSGGTSTGGTSSGGTSSGGTSSGGSSSGGGIISGGG